jgi:hypothetical protein
MKALTRILVEMPVDFGDVEPQSGALLRLATMLKAGNVVCGDRWHIVMDNTAGTIRLVPQP